MDALKSNFAGIKGAKIKKILSSASKYGNDIEDVDIMAKKIYETYIQEINKYTNTRYKRGPIGGIYGLSTSGISSNVPMGCVTAATPDGRSAWTPASEGASPSQGSDTEGPTAVLKSISKLPTILMTGGQLLNMKFSPNLLIGEDEFLKFISLIKSFVAMKCWHIQFNIIDAKTLKAAQQNPHKYRDIIVRVAGYCAQFVTLDKTTQEDIISRTEKTL